MPSPIIDSLLFKFR